MGLKTKVDGNDLKFKVNYNFNNANLGLNNMSTIYEL